MKPNRELMRQILVAAESGHRIETVPAASLEELADNVEFCIEAGYATGDVKRSAGLAFDFSISKVLLPGHEFIATPDTPETKPPSTAIALTDEHGVWWFLTHCTKATRGWLVTATISIVTTAYFFGHNRVLSQIIDLLTSSHKP